MHPERIIVLYFSPTGTTARVAEMIAAELAEHLGVSMELQSFTRPAEREREYCFTGKDLVVVAFPTYAGKLPNKILPDLKSKVFGNGALAVPIVTFGNRSYDNSLAELSAVLEAGGFHIVAAGAFVCRHAFTDELAYGRPNWSDSFEMKSFAKRLADKVKHMTVPPAAITVRGDAEAPYYVPKGMDGNPVNFLKAKPKTNMQRCNRCGACIRNCPMGAIALNDPSSVPGTCIKCHACIRKCTKQAKFFDDPQLLSHLEMLKSHYKEEKENEVFL